MDNFELGIFFGLESGLLLACVFIWTTRGTQPRLSFAVPPRIGPVVLCAASIPLINWIWPHHPAEHYTSRSLSSRRIKGETGFSSPGDVLERSTYQSSGPP